MSLGLGRRVRSFGEGQSATLDVAHTISELRMFKHEHPPPVSCDIFCCRPGLDLCITRTVGSFCVFVHTPDISLDKLNFCALEKDGETIQRVRPRVLYCTFHADYAGGSLY